MIPETLTPSQAIQLETRVIMALIRSLTEYQAEAFELGLIPDCFTIPEYRTICETYQRVLAEGRDGFEAVPEIPSSVTHEFWSNLLNRSQYEFVEVGDYITSGEFNMFIMRGQILRATKLCKGGAA